MRMHDQNERHGVQLLHADTLRFLDEVVDEVDRARAKFFSSDGCMTALTEEVGELAKAMLDESQSRIREEAVQVAAMALRVAIEGDATLSEYRARRGIKD